MEAAEKAAGMPLEERTRRHSQPAGRRDARRQGRERQCRAAPLRRAASLPQQLRSEGAFRDRRGARPDGFRDRRQAVRRPLRRAERRAGAAGARADAVHARPAHGRTRLRGDQSAGVGARRRDVRHRATAEIPRRPIRRRRRLLADPHRRGAADQSGAREHRRREAAAAALHRRHARASAPRRAPRGATPAA